MTPAIRCGEMHYARIPRAYWKQRLEMAYAMGLNAISTYAFWNRHEPDAGTYDFDGENDVAAFVREAASSGLDVVLRPGPYVCAEWDFGGLPAWLLDGRSIALRSSDPAFMDPVRRWLERLGHELAGLQRARGGPIVAVQLENEYGAFGNDSAYLRALRDALVTAGFGESCLFTIDQPNDLARGSLDGVSVAATFAAGDARGDLAAIRRLRPGAPLMCGEFWAGWFDHWGEPHVPRDDDAQLRDLRWMLRAGVCFNIYMVHGGTNFGFFNGANAVDDVPYQPTTTSYDYQAAIDEAGRPTQKYRAFRAAIAEETGSQPRPIPAAPETIDVPRFALTESAPLTNVLGEPAICDRPVPMEHVGQSFGYALYRTTLPRGGDGTLDIGEPRDFAVVCIDGVVAGCLDRRLSQSQLRLEDVRPGATLDVLVENCGRINYGPKLGGENKGLLAKVCFNGVELRNWQLFSLPLDDLDRLQFGAENAKVPAFFRGSFELERIADTFFDMRGWGKGILFVNGRNAGRYWNLGPQRSLYVPGAWLRRCNEIVVFEVFGTTEMFIKGTSEPIISV